jgi:hypothetical protein
LSTSRDEGETELGGVNAIPEETVGGACGLAEVVTVEVVGSVVTVTVPGTVGVARWQRSIGRDRVRSACLCSGCSGARPTRDLQAELALINGRPIDSAEVRYQCVLVEAGHRPELCAGRVQHHAQRCVVVDL